MLGASDILGTSHWVKAGYKQDISSPEPCSHVVVNVTEVAHGARYRAAGGVGLEGVVGGVAEVGGGVVDDCINAGLLHLVAGRGGGGSRTVKCRVMCCV